VRFAVITLFPEMFEPFARYGVVGRALETGRAALQCWNPRDYTTDRHQSVDDRPYGGGPGMVMQAEPLARAVAEARRELPEARVVYLSPQGERLTQARVD